MRPGSVAIVLSLGAVAYVALGAFAARAESDAIAESFVRIYAQTCLKHLTNLEALRTQLQAAPALPPDQAKVFLNDEPGNAWPVPDKNGTFVLALPLKTRICVLYARKLDAAVAVTRFQTLVEHAPPPLTSGKVRDDQSTSPQRGVTRMLSYQWTSAGAPAGMLFTLSTATGESVMAQGMASAAYVH
jgi:hypothetical protein